MRKKYLTELEQSRLLLGVSKLADPLAQRDFHWIGALIRYTTSIPVLTR